MKRLELTTLTMPIGLALGLSFFTFHVIGFDFAYFPGDLGDGRLNLYFLEHAHKFFTGQTESFWNAPFMFPEKDVIAYSENHLGSAPIFSFFRILGFDLFKSYQLWYLAVTALNYITAFYFLKYVFKNHYAALLGALIFAFSIALQSQLTHAQTFARFAAPLAFLMAVKFSKDLDPKYFFYSLLFLVYQLFCGIYLGLMLAVPLGIYLGISIINGLFFPNTAVYKLKWLLKMALSLLVSLGALVPLMLPYVERKIDPSTEHFLQIVPTIPTIKSFLFSHESTLIWGFLSKIGYNYDNWWDHQIFTGGIATASLVFLTIWFMKFIFQRKFKLGTLPVVAILSLTILTSLLLFLRFDNITAYIAIYYLPGFSSMRSLTRVINIELLFFSIATAFAFAQIFKMKFRYKPFVFLAAIILIVADNYFKSEKTYRTKVTAATERTEALESAFSAIPEGSIVSYEPQETKSIPTVHSQIDAMLCAQEHDLIAINAYTATSPIEYNPYWHEPNEENRNYWLQWQKIEHDSLYVVKSPHSVEKISFDDIPKLGESELRSIRMQNIIEYIKSDEEWMQSIKIKAEKNKISVDSMLILDANWILENESK